MSLRWQRLLAASLAEHDDAGWKHITPSPGDPVSGASSGVSSFWLWDCWLAGAHPPLNWFPKDRGGRRVVESELESGRLPDSDSPFRSNRDHRG